MPGINENTLTLTRALKLVFQESSPPLRDFLRLFWPTVRTYDTAEIPADTVVSSKKIARYREVNAGSNIFAYIPGKGAVYDPANLDESTPITEKLARAVTAGLESNGPAHQQIVEKAAQIQRNHDAIILSAIVKQGIDIMVNGTFQPKGKNGVNIGSLFDYDRDLDNTIPANADPVAALQLAWDQYKKKGGASNNAFALMGPMVLSALEQSAAFKEALKLQGLNAGYSRLVGDNRVVADIIPGGFKLPGRAARITLLSFDESYEDESGEFIPFMPPKGIIISSFNAPRVQAYGGIFLVNNFTGSAKMVRGELVSDSFWTKNPDAYIFRSQSRPVLVPGEIDHIVYASIT
ncbi:MAG: major capsid protein [Treponema sp.]|jgi:hypothetical protein|nr:major capsid protein [Treponema sp.]